jgi:predicted SprT family Zn-dependent metalloprotease
VLAPLDLDRAVRSALDAVGRALPVAPWPDLPVAWNRRLRRAGRAVITGYGRAFRSARIELSPAYFEVYPEDIDGILVHEVVHVGLALLGRGFGHGPEFRSACLRAGGMLHGRSLPGRVFRYQCPVCRGVLERRRRLSADRWCAVCVETARGTDPYGPHRALRLVGIGYRGVERSPGC